MSCVLLLLYERYCDQKEWDSIEVLFIPLCMAYSVLSAAVSSKYNLFQSIKYKAKLEDFHRISAGSSYLQLCIKSCHLHNQRVMTDS